MSAHATVRLLVIFWLLGSEILLAQEEVEAPPAPEKLGTSWIQRVEHGISNLVLPGEVVAWVPLERGVDEPALAVVARQGTEDSDPLGLYVWRLGGEPTSVRLEIELPGTIDALETMPSNGTERAPLILVFGESKLQIVSSDGARSKTIPMSSGFFPVPTSRWVDPNWKTNSASVFRRLGALEKLTLGPEWGEVESKWSIDLPLVVDRSWGGLDLETPPVVKLSIGENGTQSYLVGPQAHGLHRLRTMFIELEGDQSPSTFEVWSMFPGPETVEESWYVVFNDQPALIVTSVQADKHGVFEKKKIRLFMLEKDRSRSGSPPVLEAITRSRNWYSTCAGIADVNGDDLDDVVSAQPQGLGAGKLWVTAYISDQQGGFETKPLGTMLQISDGERCSLDFDFDQNGQPDLLVVQGDDVLIFPLMRHPGGKDRNLVAETPRWRIELEDVRGTPGFTWIFPDRRPQIVSTGFTEADQGKISVIRFE
jgi:hypothetical protein